MKKLTPCLWFDNQAEEAVNFYLGIFKNSKVTKLARYGKNAPMPEGTVLSISFELDGEEFAAINGGPVYTFTPAISFMVKCITQDEVDEFWDKLTDGGEIQMCGWLTDKFGITWQIVPIVLLEMMSDPDKEKVQRVTEAMLQMKKLDINILKEAFNRE